MFDDNVTYIDEVVINLFIENELLLDNCLNLIKNYRFGVLCRLPLINLFFNLKNIWCIKDLHNEILNFFTPILQIEITEKNMKEIRDVIDLFNQKFWKPYIYLNVNTISELKEGVELYKRLKCEFFDEEFSIIFNLADDIAILEYAYFNIDFIVDTIKFLGMRNNAIVDCLLKAIREKEIGISQEFDIQYKETMKMLLQYEITNYYSKRTLVRETMDDFALI